MSYKKIGNLHSGQERRSCVRHTNSTRDTYVSGNLHWGKRNVHILGIKSLCETHETCVGCVGVEKRGLNMRGKKNLYEDKTCM